MLTASAAGAARAWRVPARARTPRRAASAFDVVAQHACATRGVAPHGPGVLATAPATAASGSGPPRTPPAAAKRNARVVAAVASAPGVAATAMAFDRTGLRLWVGFADGVVREHRVDFAGGGAGEAPSVRSLRECKDLLGEPITCLRAAPTDRRLFVRTAADRVAAVDVSFFAATHTFDCDGGARGTMRAIRGAGVGGGGALRSAEGAFAGSAAAAASAGARGAFRASPDDADGRGAADGSARLFDVDVGGVGVRSPPPGPGRARERRRLVARGHCGRLRRRRRAPAALAAHAEQARGGPRDWRLLALSDSEATGAACRARAAAAMKQQRESAGFGEEATRARRPQLPHQAHPRGCARDARQGARGERRAAPRRAGRRPPRQGGRRPRGERKPRGGRGAAVRGRICDTSALGAPGRRSRRGAGNRRVAKGKRAGSRRRGGARAAPAAAPALPSFDPYGVSVGGGLAADVGGGAQPRAPSLGPY